MNSINLEYFGISPLEIEVLYKTLSKLYLVDEKNLAQESEYVSVLNIEFPVPYDENFFQSFGFDRWQMLKGIFKEMKRRRGRKVLKISLSFSGITAYTDSKLVFTLTSEIGAEFQYALEKIQHMIDAIHAQIKSQETKRQLVSYTYDPTTLKWVLTD